MASGLTVGLLSMEPLDLRMMRLEGNWHDRYKASKVLDLISDKHLIMVTLLLTNSIAMEALPVFLDKLVPSWIAVTLSVTAILIFGEILPQAFCTGPHQLSIAYRSAPIMNVLICVTYPISRPLASILDHLFGSEEEKVLDRSSLKTLVALHRKSPNNVHPQISGCNGNSYNPGTKCLQDEHLNKKIILGEGGHQHDPWAPSSSFDRTDETSDGLLDDEIVVIQGALDLASKRVSDVMTPIKKMFMLNVSDRMTREFRSQIVRYGFSRIPVYKGTADNVIGLVLVKSLLEFDWFVDDSKNPIVGECMVANRQPIFVGEHVSLWSMLNVFQKGGTHMAFIVENPNAYIDNLSISNEIDSFELSETDDCESGHLPLKKELLGLLTIEDIFEELIQEEIYDEFDFKKKPVTYNAKAEGQNKFRTNLSNLKICDNPPQDQFRKCINSQEDDLPIENFSNYEDRGRFNIYKETDQLNRALPAPQPQSPLLCSPNDNLASGFTGASRHRILPRWNSMFEGTNFTSLKASLVPMGTMEKSMDDLENGVVPDFVSIQDLQRAQGIIGTILNFKIDKQEAEALTPKMLSEDQLSVGMSGYNSVPLTDPMMPQLIEDIGERSGSDSIPPRGTSVDMQVERLRHERLLSRNRNQIRQMKKTRTSIGGSKKSSLPNKNTVPQVQAMELNKFFSEKLSKQVESMD